MTKVISAALTAVLLSTTSLYAQSLTIEELQAQIDARVNNLNPYANLLNDPDPERSMAAVQIMLESGDPDLNRMALEFGILSPNPAVREVTLGAFLNSGPNLAFVIDARSSDERAQSTALSNVRSFLNGSADNEGFGYVSVQVGAYDATKNCHTYTDQAFHRDDPGACFVSIAGGSVIFTGEYLTGRAALNEDGVLEGAMQIPNTRQPLNFKVVIVE